MTKNYPLKSAFTLIELLVVVSIIGILATLVAANLNSARSRARDAQRKSDLKNTSTALRLYYNDQGGYPEADKLTWGAPLTYNTTTYMEVLPKDPLSPDQDYLYVPSSDLDSFTLSACLENSSDPQGVTSSGITCTSGWMFQIKQ